MVNLQDSKLLKENTSFLFIYGWHSHATELAMMFFYIWGTSRPPKMSHPERATSGPSGAPPLQPTVVRNPAPVENGGKHPIICRLEKPSKVQDFATIHSSTSSITIFVSETVPAARRTYRVVNGFFECSFWHRIPAISPGNKKAWKIILR
jgi:hypothetical protein